MPPPPLAVMCVTVCTRSNYSKKQKQTFTFVKWFIFNLKECQFFSGTSTKKGLICQSTWMPLMTCIKKSKRKGQLLELGIEKQVRTWLSDMLWPHWTMLSNYILPGMVLWTPGCVTQRCGVHPGLPYFLVGQTWPKLTHVLTANSSCGGADTLHTPVLRLELLCMYIHCTYFT